MATCGDNIWSTTSFNPHPDTGDVRRHEGRLLTSLLLTSLSKKSLLGDRSIKMILFLLDEIHNTATLDGNGIKLMVVITGSRSLHSHSSLRAKQRTAWMCPVYAHRRKKASVIKLLKWLL